MLLIFRNLFVVIFGWFKLASVHDRLHRPHFAVKLHLCSGSINRGFFISQIDCFNLFHLPFVLLLSFQKTSKLANVPMVFIFASIQMDNTYSLQFLNLRLTIRQLKHPAKSFAFHAMHTSSQSHIPVSASDTDRMCTNLVQQKYVWYEVMRLNAN